MRKIAVMVLLSMFVASGSGVWAVSSVNVPLDNWIYPALEKLDGFGLLVSDIQGTRPFTRMEVARLVNEALQAAEQRSEPLPERAVYLFEKFKKEYTDELRAFAPGSGETPAKHFLKPIEEVQTRYVYADGKPRHFVGYPESRYKLRATEGTPLVHDNEGVIYGEGSNGSFQFSSSMRLMNVFSAYIQPVVVARQGVGGFDFGDLDEVEADLLKGYVKLSPWNVEIEFGRDSMWWGFGRHGELLLTNNAEPLNLLKVSNPMPTLLPWYFSYLGPFKYTFFLSQLEEDRVRVENPMFTGLHVNFKPHPLLEIGIASTMIFNGDGQPKISFTEYLASITGFNFSTPNNYDQLASLDFRLQLPFLRNAELYGEYAGEDSGGLQYPEEWFGLGDVGFLVGIFFPRLTDDGRTDLRLEFARNAHRKDSNPGVWYGHFRYRSGYTYEQLIMGHHMDGDAMDGFARITHYVRNDLQVGLDYDYMERGITLSPTQEKVNQIGADVTYDIWRNLSVTARYGFESVSDYDLRPGVDHTSHLLMTVLKFEL